MYEASGEGGGAGGGNAGMRIWGGVKAPAPQGCRVRTAGLSAFAPDTLRAGHDSVKLPAEVWGHCLRAVRFGELSAAGRPPWSAAAAAALGAAVAAAVTAILYARKNRMRGRAAEARGLPVRTGPRAAPHVRSGPASGPSPADSDRELYERLSGLMNAGKAYRRNDMSLDLLAGMLATNRAYASRAINRFAGRPFWDYINSLRMRDAVAALSDPGDDTPLKALSYGLGYNSMSAFYRAFVKETGMSPSRYRDEARRLRTDAARKDSPDSAA